MVGPLPRRAWLAAALLAAGCATGRPPSPHYEDPEAMIAQFERADRDAWQKPAEVVEALGIERKDAVLADIGSGSGYFTRRLAAKVPDGRVYAVDVEAKFVRYIEDQREVWGLPNIVPHLAHYEDPMLPEESIDLVFSANTYSFVPDRVAYFRKVRRALVPEGRVAIVDFRPDARPPTGAAPPPRRRVAEATVVAELEAAGFRLERRETFLPFQYFLVFRRADAPQDGPRSPEATHP